MLRTLTLAKTKTRKRTVLAPLLGLYELREALEARVEEHVEEMRELSDDLRLRRAFRDGRWVVGVHSGGRMAGSEDHVRDSRLFSRLDFELGLDAAKGELRAEARVTVHDRDLPGDGLTVRWDDPRAVESLSAFVEASFLGFASRYFERP